MPVLGVAVLLPLAGCTSSGTPGAASSTSAPTSTSASAGTSQRPSAGPSGTAPPEKLIWHGCGGSSASSQAAYQPSLAAQITTDCGTLTVPLDWQHPAGPKRVHLQVVRLRLTGQGSTGQGSTGPGSTGQGKRIGSLLVNPGGPGASGIDLAQRIAPSLTGTLLTRFDLIGFDPRGVGASDGLQCISTAQKDRSVALDPDPTTSAGFTTQATLSAQIDAACTAKYGNDLRFYSTESTARDMDGLRSALGDAKLTYLGFSYGTELGAVYATLFPQRIRALVLDGAVDPTADATEESAEQAGGFETAFSRFAAWCAASPQACPIAPDAHAAVTALLSKAHAQPIASSRPGDSRRATDGNVLYAVVSALYSKQAWPALAGAISNAAAGDAAGVLQLDDRYTNRTSSGAYDNSLDANTVINCTDAATQPSLGQVRVDQAQWRVRHPLFGGPLAITLLTCASWSAPTDPPPTVGARSAAAPILVVGTKGDPATPYASAVTMTARLGNARLLTADGDGHTAYLANSCVRADVNRYLVTGALPAPRTVCPAG